MARTKIDDKLAKEALSQMKETKRKIFLTALDLFAAEGYPNVGTRDIAKVVGIKSASIYNHFRSKDAIVERIYQYFYELCDINTVNAQDIIQLLDTTSPREAVGRLVLPVGGAEAYDSMSKILCIAISENNNDGRAAAIISEVFSVTIDKITAVLHAMHDRGLIKPVDIDLFATIYVSTSVPSCFLLGDSHCLTYDKWLARRLLLLDLICETNEKDR